MKNNLLYISPDFNYSCGVSKHVYISLKKLCQYADYKVFFITNSGDSLDRLDSIPFLKFSKMNFKKDHTNLLLLGRDFIRLFLFCRRNKIDIIHTHHRYPELIAVMVSKFLRIKTITTVHSFVKGKRQVSFRSDKVIAVSKSVGEYLRKNYPLTANKTITLYNCIEDSFYEDLVVDSQELRKSSGYNDNDKIVLFAGRISRIKGSDVLITSFDKIDRSLNAKLLIIGTITDDDLRIKIRESNQIKILEPQKEMRPYYKIADIVVLPSIEDPFPYVMLEAGAMKKLFIGSNIGGIGEFIEDNQDGFLVKPGSVDELTSKMEFVLKSLPSDSKAGELLYAKVKSNCDYEKYFYELSNIYHGLLKNG